MKFLATAFLCCLGLASSAQADTSYSINVNFTNGSIASGTFSFDGTDGFSNINISLTAGSSPVFGPTTFLYDRVPGSSNAQDMWFSNQSGDQTNALFIHLQFLPNLNSPTPVFVPGNSDLGDCGNSSCGTGNIFIGATGGSVTPVATPEPSTFGLGSLCVMALVLRRKLRKAQS
jgi:hypothetical protein